MTDEVWKEINGYPSYMISNHGRIKNCMRNKILKQHKTDRGYLQVYLSFKGESKGFKVHRLVAIAFIPNTNNLPEVNHIDKDKTSNYVSNLEWMTTQQNCEYSFSKSYSLNSPQGRVVKVFNLSKFCRDNGLTQGNMANVVNGRLHQHKGWTKHKE